jgi:hypothetical protein
MQPEIEASTMDVIGVVEHHGYAVVALGMFLTAAGVPLPASVLLLAAGASADPNPAHHQVLHHGLHLFSTDPPKHSLSTPACSRRADPCSRLILFREPLKACPLGIPGEQFDFSPISARSCFKRTLGMVDRTAFKGD